MYPLTCAGGYSVPLRGGLFEIVGVRATVSDPTVASQIVLYDDSGIDGKNGRILSSSFDPGKAARDKNALLCNVKGIADLDANLEVLFPEPLKTRHGVSASISTNLRPGTIQVYCR